VRRFSVDRYKTVLQEAEVEQVIDKSRFIGYIKPVETREEAEDFIQKIKKLHRGATHNVPAYVIGENAQLQWASDDGEPQGTSGAPMVQMLVKEGITNVVIVVTRYFGGIKLGTGGLVRAYTGTAKLALDAANICTVKEQDILSIKIGYPFYDKLQNLAENGDFTIKNTIYEEAVEVEIAMNPDKSEEVKEIILNLTGGTAEILSRSKELVKVPD
jgi:uncharacterized YigZ family protein